MRNILNKFLGKHSAQISETMNGEPSDESVTDTDTYHPDLFNTNDMYRFDTDKDFVFELRDNVIQTELDLLIHVVFTYGGFSRINLTVPDSESVLPERLMTEFDFNTFVYRYLGISISNDLDYWMDILTREISAFNVFMDIIELYYIELMFRPYLVEYDYEPLMVIDGDDLITASKQYNVRLKQLYKFLYQILDKVYCDTETLLIYNLDTDFEEDSKFLVKKQLGIYAIIKENIHYEHPYVSPTPPTDEPTDDAAAEVEYEDEVVLSEITKPLPPVDSGKPVVVEDVVEAEPVALSREDIIALMIEYRETVKTDKSIKTNDVYVFITDTTAMYDPTVTVIVMDRLAEESDARKNFSKVDQIDFCIGIFDHLTTTHLSTMSGSDETAGMIINETPELFDEDGKPLKEVKITKDSPDEDITQIAKEVKPKKAKTKKAKTKETETVKAKAPVRKAKAKAKSKAS